MTVAEARNRYARYVKAGTDEEDTFLAALNELLQRIIDSGKWRGLVTAIDLPYPGELLELDDPYESILAAQIDGAPATIYSRFHEFIPGGPGQIENPTLGRRCLIDNGDRTYKVVGNDIKSLRLTVKRRFIELQEETDEFPISNLGALKLGFMSLAYEDAGELETADGYFAKALATLNGELKEARGGAQSSIQMSPHGFFLGQIRRPI